MSVYIKAELALNHTVIYTDDSGKYFRFSGGTRHGETIIQEILCQEI